MHGDAKYTKRNLNAIGSLFISFLFFSRWVSTICVFSVNVARLQRWRIFPREDAQKSSKWAQNDGFFVRNSLITKVNHIKLPLKNIILLRNSVKKFRVLNLTGKSFIELQSLTVWIWAFSVQNTHLFSRAAQRLECLVSSQKSNGTSTMSVVYNIWKGPVLSWWFTYSSYV